MPGAVSPLRFRISRHDMYAQPSSGALNSGTRVPEIARDDQAELNQVKSIDFRWEAPGKIRSLEAQSNRRALEDGSIKPDG